MQCSSCILLAVHVIDISIDVRTNWTQLIINVCICFCAFVAVVFVIILNLNFLFIQGDNNVFNWSQEDQGIILSSFFWGYFLTQIPGAILSQRYGGKYVFLLGILFSAVCSLLTPNVVRLGIEHVGIFINLAASWMAADFFLFCF